MSDTHRDPARGTGTRIQRRYLARLGDLAIRFDHQAALIRNGGFNPEAEALAGKFLDDACALRWAIRQIAGEGGPVPSERNTL